MNTPARASLPVIKRLPKYYRYLCSLQADGINSISSRELAAQMGTTASQVRQDFILRKEYWQRWTNGELTGRN